MENISPIVQFFISRGVPLETVVMLLMLPILMTFIAFLRQVVGIKAFGIYTPAIATFAFWGIERLRYGVAIFVTVIIVGMLMRYVLKKFRILYLPRVAINLTVVSISILLLLALGGEFQRTGLSSAFIFPILILITLVEKFVAAQIEKGNRAALILAVETLIISVMGFYIISWNFLETIILTYPSIVLLTIPVNFVLGKWNGLRLSEYFRFKDVLKKM